MKSLNSITSSILAASVLAIAPVQARPLTPHEQAMQLLEWERAFYLGIELAIYEGEFESGSPEHGVWLYVAQFGKKTTIEQACDFAACDPAEGYRILQKGRDAISAHRNKQKLKRNTQMR